MNWPKLPYRLKLQAFKPGDIERVRAQIALLRLDIHGPLKMPGLRQHAIGNIYLSGTHIPCFTYTIPQKTGGLWQNHHFDFWLTPQRTWDYLERIEKSSGEIKRIRFTDKAAQIPASIIETWTAHFPFESKTEVTPVGVAA